MANRHRATHHHKKAGAALASGDLKLAAHHMGHALAALRQTAGPTVAPSTPAPDSDAMSDGPEAPAAATPVPVSTTSTMRARLKGVAAKGIARGL